MRHRLLLPMLLALGFLAPASALARGVKVKMATLAPKGSVFYDVLREMGEAWEKASDGKVQFKLFAGGVAGDDGDVVRKVRLKTLDGGLLTAAGVSSIHKAIHALAIPLAYNSFAELDYVFQQLRPTLEQAYLDEGFVVLAWVDAGWVRFFTTKPVSTPDDLKNEKLFVWAGQPEVLELWKAAGFNPVPLPSTEISTALQTGLITALPATPQAVNLMGWSKNASQMTDIKWAPLMGAVVISKETWESIDEGLRPKLMEIAEQAGKKLRAEARPQDGASVDAMRKRGLTVVALDAAAKATWQQRAEEVWPKLRGSYAPADLMDEALKHRDAFRKLGSFTDGAEQ